MIIYEYIMEGLFNGKMNYGYGKLFLVNMNKRKHCSINMLFYDLFMVKWRIQWENHVQIWIIGNNHPN